tara:strand:- start:252 stop:686 length:435 start_codon:yes stop_codon:yes gene_type:complete
MKLKTTTVIIFFFLFSFQLINGSNHYPIKRDSKTVIARGEILYNQYCASCHMQNLSGAKNWKSRDIDGYNLSPPLNGSGHTWHHSDELLHKIIKNGIISLVKNYKGKMVGFGDKLSDKQIDSVLSYIKSHWENEIYERQILISK